MDGSVTGTVRTLIVDDEERNLRVLEAFLISMGYQVCSAVGGREALDMVPEVNPDIILLDVMMPGVDGFEVLRGLKDNPETRPIPVVMVTSLTDVHSRVEALELGADDFLSKPVDRAELTARVRSLLKVKASHDQLKDHQAELVREVQRQTEDLTRYSRQLEILTNMSQQINDVLEIPAIIKTLGTSAAELVEADGATIGRCVEGKLHFTTFNRAGDVVREGHEEIGVPDHNDVFRACEGDLLNTGERIIPFLPADLRELNPDEVIGLPLCDLEGEPIVLLVVHGRPGKEPFDPRAIALLEGLGASAAVALKNAHAVEQLRTSRNRTKAALDENRLLLKEVHHRVKNNLQAINGLLDYHGRNIEDQKGQEILKTCMRSILSMAFVHEQLCRSDNLVNIEVGQYLKELGNSLATTFGVDDERIKVKVHGNGFVTNIDTAIPLGLVVNELISNAIEHAFPDGKVGTVSLSLDKENDSMICLEIADDGIGIPDDIDPFTSNSVGLYLIRSTIEHLRGTMNVRREKGTRYRILFQEYHECSRAEL